MSTPTRQIPGTMTTVDTTTGKETHEPMAWKVMPPAKDKCQICAVKHEPGDPHNAQSLYYQMTFNGMVGRSPTWADAIAHCDEPMRQAWEGELRRVKAWSEPPAGEEPVKHHGLDRCSQCGRELNGETALVDGNQWCHPCADEPRGGK